jgi:hypothetical protein
MLTRRNLFGLAAASVATAVAAAAAIDEVKKAAPDVKKGPFQYSFPNRPIGIYKPGDFYYFNSTMGIVEVRADLPWDSTLTMLEPEPGTLVFQCSRKEQFRLYSAQWTSPDTEQWMPPNRLHYDNELGKGLVRQHELEHPITIQEAVREPGKNYVGYQW